MRADDQDGRREDHSALRRHAPDQVACHSAGLGGSYLLRVTHTYTRPPFALSVCCGHCLSVTHAQHRWRNAWARAGFARALLCLSSLYAGGLLPRAVGCRFALRT